MGAAVFWGGAVGYVGVYWLLYRAWSSDPKSKRTHKHDEEMHALALHREYREWPF